MIKTITNNIGKVIVGIATVLGILGAVWAIDDQYTPREVTELLIADLQKNQMMIQNNIQTQTAQQWLVFWQYQVELYTGLVAKNPNNRDYRQRLNEAKSKRNYWQSEVNRHMQ